MKKLRKSSWIAIAFFIYVTATAAYLLPRNTVTSDTEKYLTLAGGYVIVLALWLVLRKKEKLQEQRGREATNDNLNKFAGGYVIVLALWLVLRKKEKLQEQRRREATNDNLNK